MHCKILPDNRASDEAVLHREHVRILVGVCHAYVRQFDVQVLKGLNEITVSIRRLI